MTQEVAIWDPNSGAALPAYLTDAFGDLGSNIPDRMTVPSLSYEGKMWTIVKDGNKHKLMAKNSDGDEVPIPVMRLVILDFNGERGRAYYAGTYNPAQSAAPICWSPDGKAPDASVKEKQSALCNGCPQSIKGSKIVDGREMVACAAHRMIAIAPAFGLTEDPLRLKIAVTSDYDKEVVEHGWFAFRQYADYLKSRGIAHTALVVTKVKFDPNQPYPKLLFALDRVLSADEVAQAVAATKNPKVKELLAEKWSAAGVNGTLTDERDIKPHGLEGAYADGWQPHPDVAGVSWKGTESLYNEELAKRYPAPEPKQEAAPPPPAQQAEVPASQQVIDQPATIVVETTAAAAGAVEVTPEVKPKPEDAAHIAHAGTEHEVWWDGAAWVKPWPTAPLQAAEPAAPPPPPAPPPAPAEPAAPPKPTDPAHIAHAGTEHEVWWDGAAWVKPWGNGQAAAATGTATGAATPAQSAAVDPGAGATTTSPSSAEVPAEVQDLLNKWTS